MLALATLERSGHIINLRKVLGDITGETGLHIIKAIMGNLRIRRLLNCFSPFEWCSML